MNDDLIKNIELPLKPMDGPILAKDTIYPDRSIVKRRVSGYVVIHGNLWEYAKVWFWDGTIKEFPWSISIIQDDFAKELVESLIKEHGYDALPVTQ